MNACHAALQFGQGKATSFSRTAALELDGDRNLSLWSERNLRLISSSDIFIGNYSEHVQVLGNTSFSRNVRILDRISVEGTLDISRTTLLVDATLTSRRINNFAVGTLNATTLNFHALHGHVFQSMHVNDLLAMSCLRVTTTGKILRELRGRTPMFGGQIRPKH